MKEGVMVPLLADAPAEELKLEMERAASLINAAKQDKLALVIGHDEEGEQVLMLATEGDNTLIPLAVLYGPMDFSWMDITPPKAIAGNDETEDGS